MNMKIKYLAAGLLAALLLGGVCTAAAAPVAQDLELTTCRGVAVAGQLTAASPEGEELTFQITTPPAKGRLELDQEGRFVYTPEEGRRGRDYFGYRVVDSRGDRSQEATVLIRIQRCQAAPDCTGTAEPQGLSSAR